MCCVLCAVVVEDDSPSLAVATSGGKILLHSPHIGSGHDLAGETGNDGEMPHVRFLNFNKKITSLASGRCVMVVAIASQLLCCVLCCFVCRMCVACALH